MLFLLVNRVIFGATKLFCTLQDFTVLPTKIFHRSVIQSSSVFFLSTASQKENICRLSFRRYYLIPSLTQSVNKTFTDDFTDKNCTQKKSFLLEIYRRNKLSVTLSVSVWNIDRRYPSVYSSVIVAATVKCRRNNSICKFVAKMSNADGYSPLVKPSVIIFKYVFKKLFRIH